MIIPWATMFRAVDTLDEKLKEAGYDMSSPDTRVKAFDALQSLTGNTGRREKRLELDLKRRGKAPNLSADERMIRDVMQNWTFSDGSRPSYQQAFQIVKTGAKPKINRKAEIRHWTKIYQDEYNEEWDHRIRDQWKEQWEAENPGQTFTATKWAKDQATKTLDEIIAQSGGSLPAGAQGSSSVPQPRQPQASSAEAADHQQESGDGAPQAAIGYLMQHPELAPAFMDKYGYLPDGIPGAPQ